MRGRKPNPGNVVALPLDAGGAARRAAALKRAVRKLRPRGLDLELRQEWTRVARLLADPTVDRLKPRYVRCNHRVLPRLGAAADPARGAADHHA